MKHIFLINNKKKFSIDILRKIYQFGLYDDLDFKIIETDSIDDMKKYAREYKNEDAIIYVIGGDGTINAILNEIVGGKAKLGVIPMGIGNNFYHSLDGYKRDIIDVNVMKVNEQYGINVFSLGIDAEIYANKEKLKKFPIPKKYLYDISALYTFFKYKNQVMGINGFFSKLTLLAICNGSYYGNGRIIAPRADISSKDVFIVSVENMPKLEIPFFWKEVRDGKHEDNPYVNLFMSDEEIHIETMNSLTGQLDGELIEGNEFIVVPNASTVQVVNNRKLIRELKK